VLYKVKDVESWYRDDEVRLWSRYVCMIDNWAASSDDIVDALVSKIVMKYEIYPLPGMTVETICVTQNREAGSCVYDTRGEAHAQS
jgi:hypothetical protein